MVKIHLIESTFEALRLLLELNSHYYIRSGELYKTARGKYNTFYTRLEDFVSQKLVEKKNPEHMRPGADKMEYKLTNSGEHARERLVAQLKDISRPFYPKDKGKDKSASVEDKESLFQALAMEFSEECASLLGRDTSITIQHMLLNLLKKYFSY